MPFISRRLLSVSEARQIALAAQGFGVARPPAVSAAHLKKMVRRVGVVQIDSVNVLARAHYMPAFSRLGSYDQALLDQAAYAGKRRYLFEYWAHMASYAPVETYPLLRWRMELAAAGKSIYDSLAKIVREKPHFVERVYAEVRDRGPISAGELKLEGDAGVARSTGWWGWSEAKQAIEYLFWAGRVTVAGRRGFERLYDLPERVLPQSALDAPVPEAATAQRELMRISSRALGVATERDLRDYFRLRPEVSKARLAELVEEGKLTPVAVEGWTQQAYLDADSTARLPRRIHARTLLSPFDPLIFERSRTERLWNFHYRIGIYTPEALRVHGYYVLPFLLGDAIVARVDLKADRQKRVLRVLSTFVEGDAKPETVVPALAATLREMAAWLALESIEVNLRGDLAAALKSHMSG